MARKFFTEPMLTEDQARRIVSALRLLNDPDDHALANKIERTLDSDLSLFRAQAEAIAAEEALRASRAAHAVLTKRQAGCLAAVRAGKGPYSTPDRYTYNGESKWRWNYSQSMGGAVRRMVEALIEEGLLTERRELTDGGRERLAAWEAKHGTIGEVA